MSGIPNALSWTESPMPDNNNSFGDSIAPAHTITSRFAVARLLLFWLTTDGSEYSTPTHRSPSNRSRLTCAEHVSVRLGRPSAGARYAANVVCRLPSRMLA